MKTVIYNGQELKVRGGAWLDIMNSCFYDVIDKTEQYLICKEIGKDVLFALPR